MEGKMKPYMKKMLQPISRKLNKEIVRVLILFVTCILGFSAVTTFLNEQSFYSGIVFACFQIFLILLPGMGLTLFLKVPVKTDVELMAVSYAAGYIINIVLYLAVVPLGLQRYAPLLAVPFAVAGIAGVLFLGGRASIERDGKGMLICAACLVILAGIEQFTYSGVNMLVPQRSENVYYNDLFYWIGNTNALMKKFPPTNFRSPGGTFNYHYFSSIQIGIMSLVTKVPPLALSLCYSFFQPVFLLAAGSYCLLRRCTQKSIFILLGMAGLLVTTGFETLAFISYTTHMYVGQFGFDYAIGMLFFLLFFLLCQYREKEFKWNYWLVIMVLFAVAAGLKATTAALALIGIGSLCIFWLVKKEYKKAFGYGIPILAVFLVMYLFVINVSGYAKVGTAEYLSNAITWESTMPDILAKIKGFCFSWMPDFVIHILLFLCYGILCNPFVYGIFWFLVFVKAVVIKKWDAFDSVLFISSLAGIWLTLYITMFGASQMYFVMCSYPFAVLFSVRTLPQLNEKLHNKAGGLRIGLTVAAVLLFIIGFYQWYHDSYFNGYHLGIKYYVKAGIENYLGCVTGEKEIAPDLYDKYITTYLNEEMEEAYRFIRENTDEYAIMASNRQSYTIGVYTERYVYSKGKTTDIFKNQGEEELAALKERNVRYLIQTRLPEFTETYDFALSEDYGIVLFENDCIRFYELYP